MSAALFIISAALVFWTLAGYPLWLARRARNARTTLASAESVPTVTAIIPVHNGGRFLAAKLASVLSSDYPTALLDVLVVSDGSTDDTDSIALHWAQRGRVRFLRLEKGGKAAALTTAFPMISAEIVLLTDVRQQLESGCIRALMTRFADATVGAVSGTLKIRSGETAGEASTGLYWKYESWIRANLSRVDSLLGATGPIYAIRRTLVRPLPVGCILDDMWLPLQVVLDGNRAILATDAVAWDYPTSLTSEFGRKVRTQAGLYQLFGMEKRLLKPSRNRLFAAFLNLKLFRLFLPYFLITAFLSSLFLASPWREIALALQGIFYGLAAIDSVLPDGHILKRASAPLAAFVTLVTAAFMAQAIFFRDPASLWTTTQVRMPGPPEPGA